MKVEIGESLLQSYLKHVKKCVFYQANWKISSSWETFNDEKVQGIYDKIRADSVFDVFKKSSLSQSLRQAEIDVIGMDSGNTIYAIDIAFHEAGLNYGSKEETKNRVLKKLLRSYLALLSYFPDKNYELIFVSPKVNHATEEIIRAYFSELENAFSCENVKFKYLSNDRFRDEIIVPTIKSTNGDSDTNELFLRATKLLGIFQLYSEPNSKITTVESSEDNNTKIVDSNFSLEFAPDNQDVFRQKLLETKEAKRTWYYSDGTIVNDIWDASKFTSESNLNGNIYSNNKVRQRSETGLVKLKLEITEKSSSDKTL